MEKTTHPLLSKFITPESLSSNVLAHKPYCPAILTSAQSCFETGSVDACSAMQEMCSTEEIEVQQ